MFLEVRNFLKPDLRVFCMFSPLVLSLLGGRLHLGVFRLISIPVFAQRRLWRGGKVGVGRDVAIAYRLFGLMAHGHMFDCLRHNCSAWSLILIVFWFFVQAGVLLPLHGGARRTGRYGREDVKVGLLAAVLGEAPGRTEGVSRS